MRAAFTSTGLGSPGGRPYGFPFDTGFAFSQATSCRRGTAGVTVQSLTFSERPDTDAVGTAHCSAGLDILTPQRCSGPSTRLTIRTATPRQAEKTGATSCIFGPLRRANRRSAVGGLVRTSHIPAFIIYTRCPHEITTFGR